MQVMFLKIPALHTVPVCHGTNVSQRDLRGFLHDITHLSCHLKLSIARHYIHFDLKCVAADACPRETSHDSDLVLLIGILEGDLLFSEILLKISLCDMHSFFLLFQKLPRRFSADLTDPALQISHTGLSRIVVDDLLQRLVAEGKHLLRKAVSL